ncbi:MAG TPA: DUF507 family protein [Polyangiaceae bacterium]|jgi:hypothetical protein|nr:DUF507 family protein [Polyangiaceae bacterium]
MKIPKARVPQLAKEMLRGLTAEGDIETETPAEVELDLQSVLNQYVKDEQDLSDKARELMARRGLPQSQLGQIRTQLAEQQKLKLGDEAIDYIVDQLIEFLMHSHNVEEIYAPDHRLRRVLREPLRGLQQMDASLDAQVRGQMKHVQEGSALWEVEYQRILEDVRRRKGM